MKKAVIRCDASSVHGRGHLSRCLSVAESLRLAGIQVVFLTSVRTRYFDKVKNRGFKIVEIYKEIEILEKKWTEKQEVEIIEKSTTLEQLLRSCDLLIIDNYKISGLWEGRIRKILNKVAGKRKIICAIDDLADRKHDCDILVDQYRELLCAKLDYKNKVCRNTKILAGKEYLLLGREYEAVNGLSPIRSDIRKIQINLGSIDDEKYIRKIIAAFNSEGLQEIDVSIVGCDESTVRTYLTGQGICEKRFKFYEGVKSLIALNIRADLAIGTAGVSLAERACCGLPSIIFSAEKNQDEAGTRALKSNIAIGLDREFTTNQIRENIINLIHDGKKLRELSQACLDYTDGLGSQRLVKQIQMHDNE